MNAFGPSARTLQRVQLPFLKGGFPFRLSTTSCVIQESILANLLCLGPHLDEVELVFFETVKETNLPSRQDIRDMRQAAKDLDISYNVHLPGTCSLGPGPFHAGAVLRNSDSFLRTHPAPGPNTVHPASGQPKSRWHRGTRYMRLVGPRGGFTDRPGESRFRSRPCGGGKSGIPYR